MPFPRPRPFTLRQKLTLLLASTATLALLVFATVALVIEVIRARAVLVRDAATQAELLAVTVAPALTFKDPGDATESLEALHVRPNVVAAWLVPEGATEPLAAFARPEAFAEPPPARTYSGHEFIGPWLLYHEPVEERNGRRLGTLILQVNPGSWWDRIGDYAGAMALLLALMLVLSLWLASRWQRVVSDPVRELAATARRVSERGDYSVRATRRSDDEIGTLVDGFNQMLEQIESGNAALRASEERLSYALRGATDGLWDWELGTTRVYYSPRWKEMLGYTEAELANDLATWEELTEPAGRERALQAVQAVLDGRTTHYEAEFRMRHKDGRWRDILARAAAVRDGLGRPARLVGTHVDITELRASEARLAEAQSIAHIGSYEVNPQTGETNWSEQMYRLRGRDRAQGPPTIAEIIESVHPEDRDRVAAALRRVFAEGGTFREEYRGVLPDGRVRHFLSTAQTSRDERGRIVRFAGTLQDITERKEAEEALAASRQLIQSFLDHAPALISAKDLSGNIILANAQFDLLEGPGAQAFVGKSVFEVFSPEVAAELWRNDQQALSSNQPVLAEETVTHKDGRAHTYQTVKFPLRGADGKPFAVCAISVDVTPRKEAEAALRASEARFRQMAGAIQQVFWLSDPAKAGVEYVSPAYEAIWGRSREDLYANPKSWTDAIHPEDRTRVWQAAQQKQAAGTYDEEYRIVRPDRTLAWIHDRAFPIKDNGGNVVAVCGVAEDITARKRAEEQRDRFFNLSLDLLCVADLDGAFRRVNPAFHRVLGFTAEELLGRPFEELAVPEDRPLVRAALAQLHAGHDVIAVEARARCRDGSTRVIEWTCPAPPPGVTELFAVGRDVTAQHAAQAALAGSELKFRQLAESAPIGIYLTDCDGACRYVNPRWSEITGLAPESAAGDGWHQCLHPDDAAHVAAKWEAAVKSGAEFQGEYRFCRPDGTVRRVEGGAKPLREAGGLVVGFVGSVADVTERRELERQLLEISDQEQARLGQEIHDGLCQHLVSTGFTARALEQQLAALRATEAAQAGEVAQLIDGAITQAYDLVGGLFPAQLAGESLASALHEFMHRISKRTATRFVIDYPEPIRLDPAQSTHLYRIAQEAVTNALKHAQPKKLWLRLVEAGDLVRLTVEDDGAAPSPAAARPGGYGLRMMRYRATLLGGSFELSARPGGGTIVTCAFRANAAVSPGMETPLVDRTA